jgi:hypothetical protein
MYRARGIRPIDSVDDAAVDLRDIEIAAEVVEHVRGGVQELLGRDGAAADPECIAAIGGSCKGAVREARSALGECAALPF